MLNENYIQRTVVLILDSEVTWKSTCETSSYIVTTNSFSITPKCCIHLPSFT